MKVKNTTIIIAVIVFVGGLFGLARVMQSSNPNVIARSGLHWHPQLAIFVDGQKQEIPANIGLMGVHSPMHTHVEDAPDGIVHLEYGGLVRARDLHLSNFFETWGKDMMTAFGTLERMEVNGEERTQFADYQIQGEDDIKLYYTTTQQSQSESVRFKTISVQELKASLLNKDFTLVNVHIPYTKEIQGTDALIPYNSIAQQLDQLPRDKAAPIVLYCQSGNMSAQAAQALVNLGYTNVTDVEGGMLEWQEAGYPLIQK